jgi:hypothetical protein
MRRGMVIIVALMSTGAFIFPFATRVLANSSSYYTADGFTIYPIQNMHIVLQREVVKIEPHPSSTHKLKWFASCHFTFYNKRDGNELVTMGYPDWLQTRFAPDCEMNEFGGKYNEFLKSDKANAQILEKNPIFGHALVYLRGYRLGKLPYYSRAWRVSDLEVLVDSQQVRTRHKPIGLKIKAAKAFRDSFAVGPEEPKGAFIWKLPFKAYETKTVRVTFSFSGLCDIENQQEVTYLLRTGALWADSIEAADIYWDLKGRRANEKSIHPKTYTREGDVLHWHFENFEPREDIGLYISYKK